MPDANSNQDAAQEKTPMLRIFKSRLPRINYIFRDGALAVFGPRTNENSGHYLTDDPVKIKELEEVAGGAHPHIYIDEKEKEVEARLADPAVAAREQIAAGEREKMVAMLKNPELLKAAGIDPTAMQKLLDVGRDFGTTGDTPSLKGIANSGTVGAAAADSNGVAQGPGEQGAAAGLVPTIKK